MKGNTRKKQTDLFIRCQHYFKCLKAHFHKKSWVFAVGFQIKPTCFASCDRVSSMPQKPIATVTEKETAIATWRSRHQTLVSSGFSERNGVPLKYPSDLQLGASEHPAAAPFHALGRRLERWRGGSGGVVLGPGAAVALGVPAPVPGVPGAVREVRELEPREPRHLGGDLGGGGRKLKCSGHSNSVGFSPWARAEVDGDGDGRRPCQDFVYCLVTTSSHPGVPGAGSFSLRSPKLDDGVHVKKLFIGSRSAR